MTKITTDDILKGAVNLYANSGFENFSIRKLGSHINISHSVIYHYYENESKLLKAMFEYASRELGRKRRDLPQPKDAVQMLQERIVFQIDNSELIVAVLKYYLSHRPDFEQHSDGFIPDKSTLHIEEVLEYGVSTGQFVVKNIQDDAKIIAHSINGFLLEYYPYTPTLQEKEELVTKITNFLVRALSAK
ncbi:MAG: TetR/AcrR family transcriptional regulator [Pseudomonadales bacterium]|nr:TetR/AcrR family transcriptional regulator [Pseudomonadales bacterium]